MWKVLGAIGTAFVALLAALSTIKYEQNRSCRGATPGLRPVPPARSSTRSRSTPRSVGTVLGSC